MENNNLKFSYYVEGEMEEKFINFLKTNIYCVKQITLCKRHSKIQKGSPNESEIKKINKNNSCCKVFIIFDKDELTNSKISSLFSILSNLENKYIIINKPNFEILLLMFFWNYTLQYKH